MIPITFLDDKLADAHTQYYMTTFATIAIASVTPKFPNLANYNFPFTKASKVYLQVKLT